MNLYMHTIGGKPAMYDHETKMIYHVHANTNAKRVLHHDLRTIKHQQAVSRATRLADGYSETDYSYRLFSNVEVVMPVDKILDNVIKQLKAYDPKEIDRGIINSQAFRGGLEYAVKEALK